MNPGAAAAHRSLLSRNRHHGAERIKVFKLLWDAIGTEFGGRHELYERNYAGDHEQIRVDALNFARRNGALDNVTPSWSIVSPITTWTDGRLTPGGKQLTTDNLQLEQFPIPCSAGL